MKLTKSFVIIVDYVLKNAMQNQTNNRRRNNSGWNYGRNNKGCYFYKKSGGGVTLSGGEPLAQADFALEVLKRCKDMNIDTTIETSGYCDNSVIKKIAEYLDLIYFDIKHMDSEKHKMYTGVPNERILENLKP